MQGFYNSYRVVRRASFFGLIIFSLLVCWSFAALVYGHPFSAALPAPTAPSHLTATVFSSAHIELNWSDNSNNESGFKIEMRSEDDGDFTQIATVGVNVTSYSSTDLQANSQYFFRVRAYNTGFNSNYSNEVSAITLPDFPAVPTELKVTTVGKTKISLEWTDNANNESGFKIERKLSSASAYKWIATAGPNATNFTNTGLSSNTTYSYRVQSYNAAGNLGYSNVVEVTTLPNVPIAPSNLTATAVNAGKINLAWTDNSNDETGFKIERKIGVAGTYAQIANVGANVKSYSNTGLSQNTNYFYRVRAYNATGNSSYSNVANAKTLPKTPAAPVNLTATTESSSKIVLAWADSANNESGFKIERTTGATAYVEIAQVGVNVKSFADVNLNPSTKYFYRARAYNAGGNSTYSNPASAVTLPNPPTAPNNLTATAVSQRRINLTWADNANNETGLKIERKTDLAGTYTQIANIGANKTSFVDSSLSAETKYFYRVRAYNTGGHSGYSNEANATTLPKPPTVPQSLVANAVSDTRIDLTWGDGASNEDGFKIERKTGAGGVYAEIATVGANTTNYSNPGLTTNTQYFYRVRAYNISGHSAYSNEASAIPFSNINLALNKTVTASSTDSSSAPGSAADGNLSTYWRSGFVNSTAPIVWLRVQLSPSSPVPVGRAIVTWNQNYFAIEYELQVSNDETNWTTVYTNNTGAVGTQDFSFTQTLAKFVRLYMKKHEKSNYRVLEFEIYATPSTAKRSGDNISTAAIPDAIMLAQNYPNPFNPSTQIRYDLPKAGQVTLTIYNSLGQEVRRLVDRVQPAGYHQITWNGRDERGKLVPSGFYHYRLQVDADFVSTKKMLMAK
jgi:hypothetical protein